MQAALPARLRALREVARDQQGFHRRSSTVLPGVLARFPANLTSRLGRKMKTETTKTKPPRPFRNFPDAIDEILSR